MGLCENAPFYANNCVNFKSLRFNVGELWRALAHPSTPFQTIRLETRMPRNITKTQSRNAQLRLLWASMPDTEFERLGHAPARLFSMQAGT